MNIPIRSMMVGLALGALLLLPGYSVAQPDAGAKARGEYGTPFWSYQSGKRSVRHAIDYSRGAQDYIRSTPKPSPQYLRADAAEIAKNLTAAKAEVAYLKKQAARDKDLAAALASIEKHLAAAEKEHQTFHVECAKEMINAKLTMECCASLSDHLTKAHDELDALQKKVAPKAADALK